LRAQTTIQILRCLTLGRYTAAVAGDELRIRGSQPLTGLRPVSIVARRVELVAFLAEWGGGVWPPSPGSELREVGQFLDCGLGTALDVVEAAQRRHAA